MRNPEDILAEAEAGGVLPFTIDLPRDDAEFLERYAVFRNKLADLELADETDKKVKRGLTWTRKSLSEWLLKGEIGELKKQAAAMEKALGQAIPGNEEAVAKYAARAFEWRKKKSA